MCLGIAGQIIELTPEQPDLATVDVMGVRRAINVGLLGKEGLKCGDWVLIHVGFAIAKMEEEEAKSSIAFLQGRDEPQTHDLAPWEKENHQNGSEDKEGS